MRPTAASAWCPMRYRRLHNSPGCYCSLIIHEQHSGDKLIDSQRFRHLIGAPTEQHVIFAASSGGVAENPAGSVDCDGVFSSCSGIQECVVNCAYGVAKST